LSLTSASRKLIAPLVDILNAIAARRGDPLIAGKAMKPRCFPSFSRGHGTWASSPE
jgi:hypothetical protein